jgi:integrase
MSVFKDKRTGKTWMYHFWHEGEQYTKKGLKTRAEAAQKEAERKRLLKSPPPTTPTSISVGTLVVRHIEYCQARMQKNTWRAKLRYFRQLIAALGTAEIPVDDIGKAHLHDFFQQIAGKEGNKNANRHLKDIKALFNWGVENDLIKTNPCKAMRPFPEDKYRKYIPPPEDVDKVLMAAGEEDMHLLICLYHTGARIGEVLGLSWEDVNFEKKSLSLWTRKRRDGQLEEDKQPMGETLSSILMHRWKHRNKASPFVFCQADGTAYSRFSKRRIMAELCTRAEVKVFGFHAIRHHVASIIADSKKASLGQIQRFLRHKRATTTELYLHEITRDQREIAELLDGDRGGRQKEGQRNAEL